MAELPTQAFIPVSGCRAHEHWYDEKPQGFTVGEFNPAQPWHWPNPAAFKPVRPQKHWSDFNKPTKATGLWTSSWLGEHGSDWAQWAMSDAGWIHRDDPRARVTLLEPHPDARVAEVCTTADLAALCEQYPGRSWLDDQASWERQRTANGWPRERCIDFYAMSHDYDALHLTEEGQWATRHSGPSMYGWDCESTFWFRWRFTKMTDLGVQRIRATKAWSEYWSDREWLEHERAFIGETFLSRYSPGQREVDRERHRRRRAPQVVYETTVKMGPVETATRLALELTFTDETILGDLKRMEEGLRGLE